MGAARGRDGALMAERVLPEWAGDDQIWLDDDHAITWTYRSGESGPSGALHWHRKPIAPGEITATPGWCVGGISFGGDGWTLESKEPLTVSPSLLCGSCGSHGFIRNGAWVPA